MPSTRWVKFWWEGIPSAKPLFKEHGQLCGWVKEVLNSHCGWRKEDPEEIQADALYGFAGVSYELQDGEEEIYDRLEYR